MGTITAIIASAIAGHLGGMAITTVSPPFHHKPPEHCYLHVLQDAANMLRRGSSGQHLRIDASVADTSQTVHGLTDVRWRYGRKPCKTRQNDAGT